jgi:hypothetical protein
MALQYHMQPAEAMRRLSALIESWPILENWMDVEIGSLE